MTCGMVLVIVSRQIDLSVGSQLGFIGVFGALLQTGILPVDGRCDLVGRPASPCSAVGAPDRPAAGRARRLCRHSVLRRHARRPALLPQRRLPDQRGAHDLAARRDLPAARRRHQMARSARSGAGSSAPSPSPHRRAGRHARPRAPPRPPRRRAPAAHRRDHGRRLEPSHRRLRHGDELPTSSRRPASPWASRSRC